MLYLELQYIFIHNRQSAVVIRISMAALSLDIIDRIFTANPNTIISTYLAFANQHNSTKANNCNKKRKLSKTSNAYENISKTDIQEANTIKYLLTSDTYMKYYQQSSWFKYFIPIVKSTTSKTTKSRAQIKSNSIDERIKLIANYFNQLDINYKKQIQHQLQFVGATEEDVGDMPDQLDLLEVITKFETLLDTGGFSSQKYETQMEALRKYYTGISEMPVFVSLILMLYNCGYFASSLSNCLSKPRIHPFLDMILEGNSAKITEFLQTYKYYSARYKFIPLFGIYLGMGYSFVIGWENEFNCMIGITENGGDYHEVLYNAQRAMRYFTAREMRYFTAREIFLKINRKDLQKEYMKMLGIKDISILLEYSRRLNICDMF